MIFDAAIIGAGVTGCSAALHLARGGMRVALLDRGAVCAEGPDAADGTLGLAGTPPPLLAHALRGREMWLRLPEWCEGGQLHAVAGAALRPAFTAAEAAELEAQAGQRRAAGMPLALLPAGRAVAIEPALSDRVLLAAEDPFGGFQVARLAGRAFRRALLRAGVALFEGRAASGLARIAQGFAVQSAAGPLEARRLVLAAGAALGEVAGWLGVSLALTAEPARLAVLARMAPLLHGVVLAAGGRLSLHQARDGAVLLAATGATTELAAMLARAVEAVPALRTARLQRVATAMRAVAADGLPVLGPLPGLADAWAVGALPAGCAAAPCLGRLLAQAMLGEAPELPMFPPERLRRG